MKLVCEDGPSSEGLPSVGISIAACAVFLLTLPFLLFNFRPIPVGSTGALLTGAFLMTAIIIQPSGLYVVLGDAGNLRVVFLTLGIMVLAQYFQREDLFARFLKRILKEDTSFRHFLCRVTFATFIISALFSIDISSVVLTPIILQIWRTQKRPISEMETLLLGISTSANLGSAFTVYGNIPIAIMASRTAGLQGPDRLDMISSWVYLALPAFVGFTLNIIFLIVYSKLKPKPQLDSFRDNVIELPDVEQSLITPNAFIDQIIEKNESPCAPTITLTHSFSTDCMETPNVHKGHENSSRSKKNDFLDSPRPPKFSVGDINAKGVQAHGPSSLYIGKKVEGEEEGELNKDQCHSLYNLDKIGYIAVSERHGKHESDMPRTISFYHSFSDLDSWQYTRDSVVHRFEQDHPRKLPLSPLIRRRMSSRGRLESVQFNRISRRKLPRQRRTSVLYKGLVSDALLLHPKFGVYRSFSGLSPSAQFLAGRREDVDHLKDIVNREFVQSKSRFFRIFLIIIFAIMLGLFFVRVPGIDFDIGLLPVGAAVIIMLVDAVWNRRNCTLILRRLNWSVIINYFAMFVFVRGLSASNFPLWIWSKMNFVSSSFNTAVSVVVFVCLVTVFTHAFGGVIFTLLVLDIPTCGSRLPQLLYLAWCTVLASNMTLHGSASNLMVSHKAEQVVQCELSYWGYLRYGLVSSIVILIVGVAIIAGIIYGVSVSGGVGL